MVSFIGFRLGVICLSNRPLGVFGFIGLFVFFVGKKRPFEGFSSFKWSIFISFRLGVICLSNRPRRIFGFIGLFVFFVVCKHGSVAGAEYFGQ